MVEEAAPSRIRTLDLIRGVAVLGILAVNVASFAAPTSATYSPNLPSPGSAADNWAYAFTLLFFEGKMRALFSMLFGASLLLYIDRKEAAGGDGAGMQLRRLVWLALFGLLHFALFWDGDILFMYACVGLGSLALYRAPPAAMVVLALGTFTLWQAWGAASWATSAEREARVMAGTASPKERWDHAMVVAENRREDDADRKATLSSYTTEIETRLRKHPDYPLAMLAHNWGETLSYVLIGMALLKSGFFAGGWSRRRLRLLAFGALPLGLALTAMFTAYVHARGYPELMMHLALRSILGFPHLLMALGYAACLVLLASRLQLSAFGQRCEAAGRMAFSNYIGSTVVMCALFYGWGLGLFGQYGAAGQWQFVLLGWALMLGWSKPWLARFRQGPLEWLWRSLTEWRRARFIR
ncbi:MAG TPA: DUF418 domain-containing protein [Novosphingobium sp.]|nr:DUF418 domain-containing protein [Novosphingobium sp.]